MVAPLDEFLRKQEMLMIHAERKDAVRILLKSIGEDPDREGLKDTPNRVAKMFDQIYGGYQLDPVKILGTTFADENHHEMVIVRDIEFWSTCEHHMLPFSGKAHIAYIPDGTVVGISKLARLTDCFARRLQIQERMVSQIADTLDEVLKPIGVAVILEAVHSCMSCRGVEKSGANTITSAMRGVFIDNTNNARMEFLNLINRRVNPYV